jgi:hypothetical protein
MNYYDETGLVPGAEVLHATFGRGHVYRSSDNLRTEVAFAVDQNDPASYSIVRHVHPSELTVLSQPKSYLWINQLRGTPDVIEMTRCDVLAHLQGEVMRIRKHLGIAPPFEDIIAFLDESQMQSKIRWCRARSFSAVIIYKGDD